VIEFQNAVVAFATAIATYELLNYFDAPEPLKAGALTIALAEWVALISLWSVS
jgi:hypothetical protein